MLKISNAVKNRFRLWMRKQRIPHVWIVVLIVKVVLLIEIRVLLFVQNVIQILRFLLELEYVIKNKKIKILLAKLVNTFQKD
jgi:hypothetical protein